MVQRRAAQGRGPKKLAFLAECLRERRSELAADFREYYHASLYDVLAESPSEAADLCVGLRAGSRTMAALDPSLAHGEAEVIAASIYDLIASALWSMGGRSGPEPRPLLGGGRDEDVEAVDADDYLAELAKIQKTTA